jgi:hypothetical protein
MPAGELRRGSNDPAITPADLAAQAAAIQKRIALPLQAVDDAAIRLHRQYCTVAMIAAITGTLAVVVAIVQQFVATNPELKHILFISEAVAAAITFAVVLFGIFRSIHHRWILKRHQTERLRGLQAKALISLLGSPLGDTALAAQVDNITRMDRAALRKWLEDDLLPFPPDASGAFSAHPALLDPFRALYMELRLNEQSRYLAGAGSRHSRLDHFTRHLPPALFFASVACVGLHTVFHGQHGVYTAAIFAMLAVCLPVLAAGLRTYREAVQVSRNAARFSSKAAALVLLRKEFMAATTLDQALRTAWHTEQVLEAEHREWLRLMLDAEWFA